MIHQYFLFNLKATNSLSAQVLRQTEMGKKTITPMYITGKKRIQKSIDKRGIAQGNIAQEHLAQEGIA